MKALKRIVLLFLCISATIKISAQTAFIKGRITDTSGIGLKAVNINIDGTFSGFNTNDSGFFNIEVSPNRFHIIEFTYLNNTIAELNTPRIGVGKIYSKNLIAQNIYTSKGGVIITPRNPDQDNVIEIKPRNFENIVGLGGIETFIKSLPGVSSGNELSSAYNVRGGSFDENLVYVNDIEIYRPQLIHSGQQEGLSIINPEMVKNVKFSPGCFDAKYGDKMSSVLDVEYRDPKKFAASSMASFLGFSMHAEGVNAKGRFSWIAGIRYRNLGLLVNTLSVTGQYQPSFTDAQGVFNYNISRKTKLSWFTHLAFNRYVLEPVSNQVSFGTINRAFSLYVAMGGKEFSDYLTSLNAFTLQNKLNNRLTLKWRYALNTSSEREYTDVMGAYRLDDLDEDIGSKTFGKAIGTLGAGSFLNHARNDLWVTMNTLSHNGKYTPRNKMSSLEWGLTYRNDDIKDKFHEWVYNDSADYNISPFKYLSDSLVFSKFVSSRSNLNSNRYSAFTQFNLIVNKKYNAKLTSGIRFNYWDLNNQKVISPRFAFSLEPGRPKNESLPDSLRKPATTLKFAGGVYNQPPFYRELRNLEGVVNTQLKAQQSIQISAGVDKPFLWMGRPFRWFSEAYYKHMNNLVPFIYDNMRIRYYGLNSSKGFAYGFDNRVNGEFIKGIESWFTLSFLRTKENITYLDANGKSQQSGYIRRPTDRLVSFSVMFQDNLPNNPSFKVFINMYLASRTPYYLGELNRYTYNKAKQLPMYQRVDIGFTKTIVEEKEKSKVFNNSGNVNGLSNVPDKKGMKSLWVSFEVFNLLANNNIISYFWVRDYQNRLYAVPEYLTGRRINLKIYARF